MKPTSLDDVDNIIKDALYSKFEIYQHEVLDRLEPDSEDEERIFEGRHEAEILGSVANHFQLNPDDLIDDSATLILQIINYMKKLDVGFAEDFAYEAFDKRDLRRFKM